MLFSTIAVKLQLVIPRTNKKENKIRDRRNLLANFIFLKVVGSNIREIFANHFTHKLILRHQSTI